MENLNMKVVIVYFASVLLMSYGYTAKASLYIMLGVALFVIACGWIFKDKLGKKDDDKKSGSLSNKANANAKYTKKRKR